jgi:ribosome-associated protein
MDIRKLQKLAVTALEDIKAKDIEVINTTKVSAMFDRVIIATGDSNRQVKALAKSVHDKVKEAGGTVIGVEGEDAGEWVLVDLGDIVVHVMQPAVRAYYNLEELWKSHAQADAQKVRRGQRRRMSAFRAHGPNVTTHPPPPAPRAGVTGHFPRPAGEGGRGCPFLRRACAGGPTEAA